MLVLLSTVVVVALPLLILERMRGFHDHPDFPHNHSLGFVGGNSDAFYFNSNFSTLMFPTRISAAIILFVCVCARVRAPACETESE